MPAWYEDSDGAEVLLAADPALYDAVGGAKGLQRLADAFYARVASDPRLRPLFGKTFLHSASILARFLAELLGGPASYTNRYGHSRMAARHQRFRIGRAEADAWLGHMSAALEETQPDAAVREALNQLFAEAAGDLVNAESTSRQRSAVRRSLSAPVRQR